MTTHAVRHKGAADWSSSVEYRVLNLPESLKVTTILPSATQ